MAKLEKILPISKGWLNVVVDIPKLSPKALIVFCHGLTGDRVGPQRILMHWAQTLCEQDFLVARFDFRGSGDSSGDFEKTTFCQMQEDLEAVVQWCHSQFSFTNIIFAGLSLGGIIATRASTTYRQCKALCLFSSDITDLPIFNLCSDPLSIREGQFFLHKKFFEERLTLFPMQVISNLSIPRFLFYGQNDKKICKIAKDLERLGVNIIEIENTGHLFESLSARSLTVKKMINQLNQIISR